MVLHRYLVYATHVHVQRDSLYQLDHFLISTISVRHAKQRVHAEAMRTSAECFLQAFSDLEEIETSHYEVKRMAAIR